MTKWTPSSPSPPMFVSMILAPIWQLYDAAVRDRNGAKAGRMAVKLGLDVPPRELEASDPRTVLQVGFPCCVLIVLIYFSFTLPVCPVCPIFCYGLSVVGCLPSSLRRGRVCCSRMVQMIYLSWGCSVLQIGSFPLSLGICPRVVCLVILQISFPPSLTCSTMRLIGWLHL